MQKIEADDPAALRGDVAEDDFATCGRQVVAKTPSPAAHSQIVPGGNAGRTFSVNAARNSRGVGQKSRSSRFGVTRRAAGSRFRPKIACRRFFARQRH